MKVISFSLFSPDGGPISQRYLIGLEANWIARAKFYPEWEMIIYHDKCVPDAHLEFMQKNGIRHVLRQSTRGRMEGCFWRFSPVADPRFTAVLVRDIDSRLNIREKCAVEEWIESQADFHVMRDSRWHRNPMMGGMWGCRGKRGIDIDSLVEGWQEFGAYGCDERFLRQCVWPIARNSVVAHDSHPLWARRHAPEGLRRFPSHQEFKGFVGQVVSG